VVGEIEGKYVGWARVGRLYMPVKMLHRHSRRHHAKAGSSLDSQSHMGNLSLYTHAMVDGVHNMQSRLQRKRLLKYIYTFIRRYAR
jgi:hypothetical protein